MVTAASDTLANAPLYEGSELQGAEDDRIGGDELWIL